MENYVNELSAQNRNSPTNLTILVIYLPNEANENALQMISGKVFPAVDGAKNTSWHVKRYFYTNRFVLEGNFSPNDCNFDFYYNLIAKSGNINSVKPEKILFENFICHDFPIL